MPKKPKRKAVQDTVGPAPRPAPGNGRRGVLVSVGLVALTLAVFASVRGFDFVNYDDPIYVATNPHISDGVTWASLRWAFTAGYAANWHPLTWLSHMTDVELFGLSPGAHHLVNVLLHAISTLLLFGLFRKLTGSTARSAFVAALFAVHPLHVESVAWVAERKDVLSGVFWMLTLWAYAAYARAPTRGRYVLVAASLALGLMAKPMLVTMPLVLLLMDVWPLERIRIDGSPARAWVELITEKVPLLVLAGASSVLTVISQRRGDALIELNQVPVAIRISNAIVSYAGYIVKMIWPADLVAMYPLPRLMPRPELLLGAVVLLVGISFGVAKVARRHPVVLVGWLWYLVTLVPVIGLVQVGAQAMADRYTYLPLIGLFVMIAWGVSDALARWPWHAPALRIASALSVAACALLAFRQTLHWKDSLTLWTHAVRAAPDNYYGHGSLGYVYWTAGNTDEAIAHYQESLRLRPDYAQGLNNMGVALSAQGRVEEALRYFTEAVRLKPDYVSAVQNLRATQEHLGSNDPELAHYANAVRAKPDDLVARNEYGAALAARGRLEAAAEQFTAAARIDPAQPDVQYNLGMILAQLGRTTGANEALRAALRLNPQHEAARQALRDLGERPATP